jgi:hypothetical protein
MKDELPEHIWRIGFNKYYCEICREEIEGRERAMEHPEICKGEDDQENDNYQSHPRALASRPSVGTGSTEAYRGKRG